MTWFVYGRVEESEDVLERVGGHDWGCGDKQFWVGQGLALSGSGLV